MQTIRTILFERHEREALAAAQNLIHVAYPMASDPLAAPGAGVADNDPRIRVLGGLARNAYDPATLARMLLAAEVLRDLLAAVEREATETHWREQAQGRPLSPTEEAMTAVLVEERTRQVPTVRTALRVVEDALAGLSETDDPAFWRDRDQSV